MIGLYNYPFTLTRVIDGDTVVGDIDLGFNIKLTNQRIRLIGINTPEIKGAERPDGLISKKFVEDTVMGKKLRFSSEEAGRDNFGRLLGTVWYMDETRWVNLNGMIVTLGYGENYLV